MGLGTGLVYYDAIQADHSFYTRVQSIGRMSHRLNIYEGTGMKLIKAIVAASLLSFGSQASLLAQESPDQIFTNGTIVTVDDYFSMAEAVAIRGERILAVGSNVEIESLAGPRTQRTDLGGRMVIPGLIDNHNHVIRATEYWPNEARLDGVTSRAEALRILEDKANSLPDGEWLMSLGGWSEAQFIDSQADFTLDELDDIAPDRPAFLQSVYSHAFANTAWFEAMDIPLTASRSGQGAAEGVASYVLRDSDGRVTGRLNGGFPMIEAAIQRFPSVSSQRQIEAIKSSFTHLNSIGLTTVYDPAGVGIRRTSYARLRDIADELTIRTFHTLGGSTPRTPQDVSDLIDEIHASKPFQGDAVIDLIAVGEIYYAPFHWDNPTQPTNPSAADIATAREVMIAAAEGGWSLQTHAILPETIDHLLDLIEDVNSQRPIKALRWTITHADAINAAQLERVRNLGMNVQIRSEMVMGGREPIFVHGDSAPTALRRHRSTHSSRCGGP
jgi:predicted amidohydrolase YtcJ